MNDVKVPNNIISQLVQRPSESVGIDLCGTQAVLSVAIPYYEKALQLEYGNNILPDIATASQRSGIACKTLHFGLIIHFAAPTQLHLHDTDSNLLGNLKQLIGQFEVVVLKNAFVDESVKDLGHRNRFPHLKFHRDRNETQPTPYSLYTRDPRCAEQVMPRISSTLFIPNIVAYLQCMKERDYHQIKQKGVLSHYDIFYQTNMDEVLGKTVLEHRWDEPQGIGEVSMLDNRTTLHASYLRDKVNHGYRIGVRYLK